MLLNNLVLNINIFNIGYVFIALRAGIFKIKHPFFLPLLFLLIYLSANSSFTRLTDENTTPYVHWLIGRLMRPRQCPLFL